MYYLTVDGTGVISTGSTYTTDPRSIGRLSPDEARRLAEHMEANATKLRELAAQADVNVTAVREKLEADIRAALDLFPCARRVNDSVIALTTDDAGIRAWRTVVGARVYAPDADQPLNWRVGSGLAHAYPGDRTSPLCERHVAHVRSATDNDRRCRRCAERALAWGVK